MNQERKFILAIFEFNTFLSKFFNFLIKYFFLQSFMFVKDFIIVYNFFWQDQLLIQLYNFLQTI